MRQLDRSGRGAEGDRFLYRSVSRKLRDLIDAGTYATGTQLPSAGDLARDFGVSMITIRRAIRDLSLEGLLVGRQGLGVFVANRRRIVRVLSPSKSLPFEDELRKLGLIPGVRLLQVTLTDPNDGDPFQLGTLGVGYRVERIILADDEPICLDSLWLPKEVGEALMPKIRERFMMPFVEALKGFDHFEYQFEGATATEEQAAFLEVTPGFPVLNCRSVGFRKDGTPLLVGCTVTRADRIVYRFSLGTNVRERSRPRRTRKQ
ncbi:GntR family transcriptional regulator [Bradyrhizobium genosp. P]|uniref:GntR family transcriptional regulator n=1 Tax=Bradyrhizobium genosp. P TaxID=83641 RepID=UPI003CF7CD1F